MLATRSVEASCVAVMLRVGMRVGNYAPSPKSSVAEKSTLAYSFGAQENALMDWTHLTDDERRRRLAAYVHLRRESDPTGWSLRGWVKRAKRYGGPATDGTVRHFMSGMSLSMKQRYFIALAKAEAITVNQMLLLDGYPPNLSSPSTSKVDCEPVNQTLMLPPAQSDGPRGEKDGGLDVAQADQILMVLANLVVKISDSTDRQRQDAGELKELLTRLLDKDGDMPERAEAPKRPSSKRLS